MHKVTDSSKSFTCMDREHQVKSVGSMKEAEELAQAFRSAHAKEEPIVKLFTTGSVIIYQYNFEWKSFSCTVKTYSWETGKSLEEARQKLKNNSDKRFSGKREVYAWSSAGKAADSAKKDVIVGGVTATFKSVVGSDGRVSSSLMTLANPRTDSAVHSSYIIDGQLHKQTYVIEPGEKLQVSLAKFKSLELLMKPIAKSLRVKPTMIDNIKNYIRQWFIEEQGEIKVKKPGAIGPRG